MDCLGPVGSPASHWRFSDGLPIEQLSRLGSFPQDFGDPVDHWGPRHSFKCSGPTWSRNQEHLVARAPWPSRPYRRGAVMCCHPELDATPGTRPRPIASAPEVPSPSMPREGNSLPIGCWQEALYPELHWRHPSLRGGITPQQQQNVPTVQPR